MLIKCLKDMLRLPGQADFISLSTLSMNAPISREGHPLARSSCQLIEELVDLKLRMYIYVWLADRRWISEWRSSRWRRSKFPFMTRTAEGGHNGVHQVRCPFRQKYAEMEREDQNLVIDTLSKMWMHVSCLISRLCPLLMMNAYVIL